jgi:uncharacterized protein
VVLLVKTVLISALTRWHGAAPPVGFVVGFLVGLTGMGGGAIMTPVMVLMGGIRPMIAVGTDLVWGTITRAVGAFIHFRQRNADLTVIKRLAVGSIPGALAGVAILAGIEHSKGDKVSDVLVLRTLGITLILVAFSLLFQFFRGERKDSNSNTTANSRRQALLTALLGAIVGFLVSFSSVGSGSLTVIFLLALYPTLPPSRIVGSDLIHSLFLVATASLGHLGIGTIDVPLLIGLLVGSLPGVWLGSKLSVVLPGKALRPVLATTCLALGYKLL